MSIKKRKVSIIVTTKDEEKNIANFCQSVLNQTYKNIELIVVDHPDTIDKTFEIARKYTKKVYKKGPERSAQRNYGAKISSGDYLMILDADMILTKDVVKECIEAVTKTDDLKCVIIPEKSIGNSFWAKCKAFERNFYYIDNNSNIEAERFFEKKVFEEVGGYDLNITGPEDWDLPERIRQKYPKRYKIKSYIIHNEGNVSLIKLIKKKYYYAKKSNIYLKKHGIKPISAKTIYFLRPVFYKNWKLWLQNPIISIGTITMLTAEFLGGTIGFIRGKFTRRNHL